MPSNHPPNKRLFIGSLPYRFSEGELLALFVNFGRIVAVKIMRNKWGKSRGLGFIEFETLEQAVEAKTKMHNHKMVDRTIIVDYAEPDPFLTPEGSARHQEKVAKFAPRVVEGQPQTQTPPPKLFAPHKAAAAKPSYHTSPKKFFTPQRQSVYDSRTHHAKVGAKFASRKKK